MSADSTTQSLSPFLSPFLSPSCAPSLALSDTDFQTAFESCTLPAEAFDHIGHLRIGWVYARALPLNAAIQRTCDGIQALASHLGAPDKFHYTLTEVFVRLIAQRIKRAPAQSFSAFLQNNPDLLSNALPLIHQHYSAQLLASPEAKRVSVQPDILAIISSDIRGEI